MAGALLWVGLVRAGDGLSLLGAGNDGAAPGARVALPPAARASAERVVPGPADETGSQGILTTYAVHSPGTRTLFLCLDNANQKGEGYEGFSAAERAFAREQVAYARARGLQVLLGAHVPPNYDGRHGADYSLGDEVADVGRSLGSLLGLCGRPHRPDRARIDEARAFLRELRRAHPGLLAVFGHLHPSETRADLGDRDVDLGDGRVDVAILSAQKTGGFTKILSHVRGRCIEAYQVPDTGRAARAELRKRVHLGEDGTPLADGDGLGAVTGVTYCMSDLHSSGRLEGFCRALARDAVAEHLRGRTLHYLLAGDVVVSQRHLPVRLPQHENLLWVPGNHCYLDHDGLDEVVDFLQPVDGRVEFAVPYRQLVRCESSEGTAAR